MRNIAGPCVTEIIRTKVAVVRVDVASTDVSAGIGKGRDVAEVDPVASVSVVAIAVRFAGASGSGNRGVTVERSVAGVTGPVAVGVCLSGIRNNLTVV